MCVYYTIEDDCYEDLLEKQVQTAKSKKGEGTFERLFEMSETYTVK